VFDPEPLQLGFVGPKRGNGDITFHRRDCTTRSDRLESTPLGAHRPACKGPRS
jgi:hypothetical protein